MKAFRFISSIICLALMCPAWAAPVTESQARQVAANFISTHFKSSSGDHLRLVHKASSIMSGANSPFYVYNAGDNDGGFVIVAGDDRVPQVLGYSDNGTFDSNEIPEAMQELLDDYAAQIAALNEGGMADTHISSSQPIAPMVKCAWSQNSPYNTMLPFLSTGKHAAVGCVATAMAQVMYYWKWPKQSNSIPAYTTETSSIVMPALPEVDFDWNSMQNTYLTTDTVSAAGRAAAQLSLYCAQSVEMDFQKNSSAANTSDVPLAMYYFFDYSPNIKYLQRKFYTTQQWEAIVLDELKAQRPVIYRGTKNPGGHAFVCDGYDGDGRFHFNWGWNGSSNGYFLLNVLNPDLQGTGSASGTYGYVYEQSIVCGIKPGGEYIDNVDVTVRSIEIKTFQNSRVSSNKDFSVSLSTQFANYMPETIDFDYGWGLYDGDNMLNVLDTGSKYGLQSWYYTTIERMLYFGSGISSGSLRIKPIYRKLGDTSWTPCVGSEVNYIEVNINGNTCTLITHGTALEPVYQVNSIDVKGNMHVGRPVDVTVSLTNMGNTHNNFIYMFANGTFISMGFVDLNKNETGTVDLRYMPEAPGVVTLKFALDKEGTRELASRQITINSMPDAILSGTAKALNVTDAANKIMTADNFGVELVVTNDGNTTYDEDISIKLYKRTQGTSGTSVQSATQHIILAPHSSTTLTFHLDNVIDGWKYFAKAYYYSAGEQINLANISTHTIVFPTGGIKGDVNGDGEVSIADVNAVISIILKGEHNMKADVNGDGEITIADVNAVIELIIHS